MFWKKDKNKEDIWEHDPELDLEDVGDSDNDEDGPTLVTVDDGKGGIKQIKVDRPVDTQSEFGRMSNDCNISMDGFNGMKGLQGANKPRSMSRPGLGELLKYEMKGKSFLNFSMEPHSEKLRKRIVSKNGSVNVGKTKVSRRKRQYFRDLFNTMLDMQWRYVHLLFMMSFILSWLAFGLVWWLIVYLHGDLEEEHLPPQQSIAGVMIQACMVGIIFSKLSRPKKRSQTLMFSKNAVVCRRDGFNNLLFRVGNMRNSSLVEAHVRAILISKRVTQEGEVQPYHQTELKVGTDPDGEEDCLFFIWPTTIVHKIDEESPFYSMSARDFFKKRYEIVVMIEGVVEQTGNSVQARSSYMPNEVLWGYRFVNLLNFRPSAAQYKVDFSAFNAVYKSGPGGLLDKNLEAYFNFFFGLKPPSRLQHLNLETYPKNEAILVNSYPKVNMDNKSQKERDDENGEDGEDSDNNKNGSTPGFQSLNPC